MKRQKRSSQQIAFIRGFKIGISGRSRDLCPNQTIEIRQQWMQGWREGRKAQWAGMTGVAGIHLNPLLST